LSIPDFPPLESMIYYSAIKALSFEPAMHINNVQGSEFTVQGLKDLEM